MENLCQTFGSSLTKIIYGIVMPRESEKKELAAILGKSQSDLFPEHFTKEGGVKRKG